jgi:tRNA threonylcarbamoyladenosine biosynthesis protein TsaE
VRNARAAGARLTPPVFEKETGDPEATRALGEALGRALEPGDLVLLEGELGTGKTVFMQGLARGLGLRGAVKSPTFTLVHEHHAKAWPGARTDLAHLDLYRLAEGAGLLDLGLDDFLAHGVVAAEWGARLAPGYPEHVRVTLADAGAPDRRRVRIEGAGARGEARVKALLAGRSA